MQEVGWRALLRSISVGRSTLLVGEQVWEGGFGGGFGSGVFWSLGDADAFGLVKSRVGVQMFVSFCGFGGGMGMSDGRCKGRMAMWQAKLCAAMAMTRCTTQDIGAQF